MNKDNIIVLSAVLILLIAMFSYNSFPNNYLSSDLSVTGKATTTFEKCSIRQAGWSSSPDSLQKITQIKQGQTVYMYISTNNCAGEEITFELYRLKKRFLLKDSLVLIASSTKTVSSSSKLSAPVVASINTEDGSSSNYRFRVRLTKYLPATNTTNTTLPPPPTTNTSNKYGEYNYLTDFTVTSINFLNQSDIFLEGNAFFFTPRSLNIGKEDLWRPDSNPFYFNVRTIVTIDNQIIYNKDYTITANQIRIGEGYNFQHSITINKSGNYCIKEFIDSTDAFLETNEFNNELTKCIYITMTPYSENSDLFIEKVKFMDNNQEVTSIKVINNSLYKLDVITTIRNMGEGIAYSPYKKSFTTIGKFSNDLYYSDGTKVNGLFFGINQLMAGEFYDSVKTYYVKFSGNYCLYNLTVDVFNVVKETNENNNKYQQKCFSAYN